jgi:hypothetical protein
MNLHRFSALATVGAVAALAGGAGVAVSALNHSSSGSPPAPSVTASPAPTQTPTLAAIPAAARTNFAVFRRWPTAADKLPSSIAGQVPAPGLARRLPAATGDLSAWATPRDEDGSVCISLDHASRSGLTACSDPSSSKQGKTALTATDPEGRTSIVGFVPDGVTSVTVTLADGSAHELAVNGNSYAGQYQGNTDHVSFTGPDGSPVVVPMKSTAG